jgi:hypothetical protein
MGRIAAARALSVPYAIDFAQPGDDPEIRQLLRESAFGGDVRLSLAREPDSRLSGAIEGDAHGTVVARDSGSGELAGIASRSVRDVFLNGHSARLGYLGQLRIAQRFRSRRELLQAGFDFCRRVHERERDTRLYLASVLSDNDQAKRLLSRRASGWPRFEPVDTLVSLAIPASRGGRQVPAGVTVRRGAEECLNEIIACVSRNGVRFQFYPRWRAEDFGSARLLGVDPSDFVIATRSGRTVGCIACWDQRAFKQVIVRGYSSRLARWRPLINLASPLTGIPRLPREGRELQFAYLSHVAVDGDAGDDVMTALVSGARERAAAKGLDYVVLGLSSRCRSLAAVKRAFKHRAYESVLYVAFWPDGEEAAHALDGRPSYPELALL